ncbi:hypothetical protein D3C79_1024960 [compost metagenome]
MLDNAVGGRFDAGVTRRLENLVGAAGLLLVELLDGRTDPAQGLGLVVAQVQADGHQAAIAVELFGGHA